jgi:hypothetical protein
MEPYGAPWLQPVAINRKRTTPKDGYKPTPLPSVATHCLRCSMVRRGSTVRVRQRALQKRCNGHFSVQADLHMLQTAVGMEPFVEPSGRGSALVRRQNCLFALVPHSEEHADAGHDCSEGTVEWATRSPVLPRRPKPTSCPPYAVWSGSCSRVTGSFLLRPAAGSEIAGACAAFPPRDAGRPSASASERERPTRGPSRLVDTRNAAGARSCAAAPPTASVRRNSRYPNDTIRNDLRPSPERPRDGRRAQRRPEAAAQRSR